MSALTIGLAVLSVAFTTGWPQQTKPATPPDKPMTGFLFKSLTQGGQALQYVVYVPRNYDARRKTPAILFLHGQGESGTDGLKLVGVGIGTSIIHNHPRWPFIVVMPQKPDAAKAWEAYDAPVMAALAATQGEYNIDADRIALTGLSQGGHGVWSFGAAHPDVWSALVPICGYARPLQPAEIAAKVKALPTWAFHGEEDDAVPVQATREVIAALRAAGAEPKLTIYPRAKHNAWDAAYAEAELPKWLLAQRRGGGGPAAPDGKK
jgi:predicted peptidase